MASSASPHRSLSGEEAALHLFQLVCNGTAAQLASHFSAHPLLSPDLSNEKGDTPLMMAARRGNESVVEELLKRGASVKARNLKGSSPLIAAAMKGHAQLCRLFLEHHAEINEKTDSSDTALSLAIWQNHTEVCLLLVDRGAHVSNVDKFGDTMLLDAAKHGNVAVMTKLLDLKQIELDHRNKKGDTALIRAAWRGEVAALQLLLDRGANTALRNSQGCTALLMSAMHNHRECFTALLEKTPLESINAVDESGNNALFYLASYAPLPVLNSSSVREEPFWSGMTSCITLGIALNAPENMGSLLLCRAANNGRLDVVRALLQRKVDVNFRDANNKHRPALHAHLQSQADPAMVALLLDAGAQIDCQDTDGNTALILAVRQNLVVIVELLLARGASLTLETHRGESALSLAAQCGSHSRCLALLTDRTASQLGWNALLLHAAAHGDSAKIQDFISSAHPEIDLDYTNAQGRSALMLACAQGHLATVQLLLEAGVNIHLTDRDGCTALVLAIRAGHKDIAELLAKWEHNVCTTFSAKRANAINTANIELENITRFLLRLGVKMSTQLAN